MASPETVPRDLDETTVTIIQDTPERRLAVLGEIDEAYGRDVRAGARNHLSPWPRHASAARARPHNERGPRRPAPPPREILKGIFPRPASDAGRARLRPHGPAPRLHAGLAREDGRLVRGPPAGV